MNRIKIVSLWNIVPIVARQAPLWHTIEHTLSFMRKAILLALLAWLPCLCTLAQSSMTDEQVMQYIMQQHANGSTQSQIVTQLMQRGVTVQQIQRVRQKYERMQNSESLGGVSNSTQDRTRTNNATQQQQVGANLYGDVEGYGYVDEDDPRNQYSSGRLHKNRVSTHTYDEWDEEFMQMTDEMNQFYPVDTAELYLQLVEKVKEKWNKREVFGRDIFNNENLTFNPAMNIATPDNYVLGPGDDVYIDIFGASQKSIEGTISPDGTVTIDGYGPVTIGGMTVAQANSALRAELGTRYSSSSIRLTVGQTRTISVNVMGEVAVPGTYTLSAFSTVLNALYMAGGTNDIGTLRDIKVYRDGRLISTCDLYDYLFAGTMTGNVRLDDNDVIIVGPYTSLVNISGKVRRPMYYEMRSGESLATLLQYAGGFAGDAYRDAVRVVRKSGRLRSVYNVEEFDMGVFTLLDEDSVSVDSVIDRYENMVEVKGAVFRPGMFDVGGSVNSVRTLIQAAAGVTEAAFTNHAVMHRMKTDRTLEVVQVPLQGILDGTTPDIPLRANDVLFVPSKREMMAEQTITIFGEVFFPGIYQYADGETIEDFILQAGGLKETASMVKVDVARRRNDPYALQHDSIVAETFSFALKDGFVIDGEPGFTLQPFDHVYVRKSPGYMEQQNVQVEGEVRFEGTYTLSTRDQRLSDLVQMAGGLGSLAFAEGASLERTYTTAERERAEAAKQRAQDELEANIQEIVARSGNASAASLTAQQLRKYQIGSTYPVGIELDKALANPGGPEDIILRAGDKLYIPQYNGTVKINGEVLYPNTVTYTEGKGYKYYLNQAGGYSNKAKKRHAYIVYMNGKVAKAGRKAKPAPGCEIVVPAKNISTTTTQERLSIATSVGSFAAIIATIANIIN